MKIRSLLVVACCAGTVFVPAVSAEAAPRAFANCGALNKVYPHGVGKVGAKDKSTSKSKSFKPVTTFKRDNATYAKNTLRDGDKDGIACEKR